MTTSPFTAGPSSAGPPKGDVARQAIASLRGYAYQLYASALAWLELGDCEELYLEVAEDYAVTAQNAFQAVQVKDSAESGSITIRSESVHNTIDGLVDLVERNPGREITLRFLSTSSIGRERETGDRVNGEGALLYWRKAAAGADIAPLRAILARLNLTDRVKAYVNARNDEQLRRELLRRIHWDCGQPDLMALREELDSNLIRFGGAKLRLPAAESARLSGAVLEHLLTTVVTPGLRRLRGSDLLTLLSDVTRISVPRHAIDDLLTALASKLGEGQYGSALSVRPRALEREADLTLPTLLAKRNNVVTTLLGALRCHGAAVITGATGMGKTLVARLCARDVGGEWFILDLRDATASESVERLRLAIGRVVEVRPLGVILDDINEIEDPAVQKELARFLAALRRRDALCLFTLYRQPSARVCTEIDINRGAHLVIPYLTREEVGELVTAAGGDAQQWASAVHLRGAFGHPQLVQAVIIGLRTRSWPVAELSRVGDLHLSTPDVEAERRAIRRSLVAAIPDAARTLLYRLSLIIGRFDDRIAVAVGAVEPPVLRLGEQLDQLVGPWVDQTGGDELRISPLVSNAGQDMLASREKIAIHRAVAEEITRDNSIDVARADTAFLHGLLGESETALFKIAHAIIAANSETRSRLAEWMIGLRFHHTDRPIFPINMTLSRMLRLAQYSLLTENGEDNTVRACWNALFEETQQEPDASLRATFEILILSKLLIGNSTARIIHNWIDLLLRLKTLIDRSPVLASSIERPSQGHPPIDVIGFLFINQAIGLRSITDLAVLFDKLDTLEPEQRDRLFVELVSEPDNAAYIVNHAWLEEHNRGDIDWLKAEEHYARMAVQAVDWGYPMLALRCHVARAVMLDEYGGNPSSALAALDEAECVAGSDSIIARARAKILYRSKDYASALPLLRGVASHAAFGSLIERAFMLREAGISAAELGEWVEAGQWFASAREAAVATQSADMRAMAIGLRADAALAAFKIGDATKALRELATTVEELETLDPNSSTKAAYCHRVVRHMALWLYSEGTGRDIEVDGSPIVMEPGACSNTEPPEDIWNLPLGPLALIWYLLAETDIATGAGAGIETSLPSRLRQGPIPAMEIILGHARVVAAISRCDPYTVVAELGPWVESQVYLAERGAELHAHDPMHPVHGTIPRATPEQLRTSEAIFTATDTVLAFGLSAAISGEFDALVVLSEEIERVLGPDYPGLEIAAILSGGDSNGREGNYRVASLARAVAERRILDPNELFLAGVRFVEAAARSNFKRLLDSMVGDWVRDAWTNVARNQRFRLRNPRLTVPAIVDACASGRGLERAARILLAAEPAVTGRIDAAFREFLRSLTQP